jgi:hypothetical protein
MATKRGRDPQRIALTEADFDLLFRQGATRIAPGLYFDRFGDLHYCVPELLALVDLPDTPENRARLVEIVADVARRAAPPGTQLVFVDHEE